MVHSRYRTKIACSLFLAPRDRFLPRFSCSLGGWIPSRFNLSQTKLLVVNAFSSATLLFLLAATSSASRPLSYSVLLLPLLFFFFFGGFGADQRPTRSARPVVVRMARRRLHGFVKMTVARMRARSLTPTRNTRRRLVIAIVPSIVEGNHQRTTTTVTLTPTFLSVAAKSWPGIGRSMFNRVSFFFPFFFHHFTLVFLLIFILGNGICISFCLILFRLDCCVY